MQSRRILFRLVPALLLASSMAAGAEAAVYRNAANIRPGHVAWIYSQPDAASQRVGYIEAGALHVRTIGCRKLAAGGWCHVVRRGTRGWIQDRYLKADNLMRG